MPGFVFNLGVDPPEDGRFVAPSDALIVVIGVDRIVRGLTTIQRLVQIVGTDAPVSEAIAAIEQLSETGDLELPLAKSDQYLLRFESGVVVVRGTDIGVLPHSPGGEASPGERSEISHQAFRAMGVLPGLPPTLPGVRHYRCTNGHDYELPAGSAGALCPAGCGGFLVQS